MEADRRVAWVREMTKQHEEIWHGTAAVLDPGRIPERGEFVVVVEGAGEEAGVPEEALDVFLKRLLEAEVGVRTAAALAQDCLGVAHKMAYARALALKPGPGRQGV